MNLFRNWITRPSTPAELARALSLAGHQQHKARVSATAALMREQTKLGHIAPLEPREAVVAGARNRRRAGACPSPSRCPPARTTCSRPTRGAVLHRAPTRHGKLLLRSP